MKLEVVDRRSPALIRVASVQEVDTYRIKVSGEFKQGSGEGKGGCVQVKSTSVQDIKKKH